MPCAFCDRDPEAGEPLFEDRYARVILHPDSAVRGHAMVVSQRHVDNLADLSEEETAGLMRIQRAAERVLLDATGTERAILLKLGIQTPHLHIHIYPVSATLDRAAVDRIMAGGVSEPRESGFGDEVRNRLRRLTSRAE